MAATRRTNPARHFMAGFKRESRHYQGSSRRPWHCFQSLPWRMFGRLWKSRDGVPKRARRWTCRKPPENIFPRCAFLFSGDAPGPIPRCNGQRLRLPGFTAFTSWILAAKRSNDWLEIVGVAGGTPNRGLREPIGPAVYVPYTLLMGDSMNLVIRTETAPLAMMRAVREQIHSIDAGQPVTNARTAEDLLRSEGWASEQFVAS